MSCTFIKNDNGEITSVRKPDGSPSELFQQALDYFGDRQQAIDAVAISQTQDFEDVVLYTTEEPSLQKVLDYIKDTNENKILSPQQNQDLKNSLISTNSVSIEEFQDKVNKAFYVNNLFNPTEQSLRNSGLYTPYEIENILGDIQLQQRIKSALEGLNNSPIDESQYEDYFDVTEYVEKTDEVNSFGKFSVVNPYVVEKTIVDALAAPVSRTEFDEKLTDVPYPAYLENLNTEQEYDRMRQYVRAEVWEDVDGEVTNTPPNPFLTIKKAEANTRTLRNIEGILAVPDVVLEENFDNVQVMLRDIETTLATEGLDVIGISERVDKPFLQALRDYLFNPITENVINFEQAYSTYFEVDTAPKTIAFKNLPRNRNYVSLATEKSEDVLLEENNLLKVGEDLYIKVRRQPIDDLYAVLATYPQKFPPEINDEFKLREYVQQQSAKLQNIENPEYNEEIYLLKTYFDAPINPSPVIDTAQEAINEEAYNGNTQYLTTEFVSDFYIEYLRQKLKNSEQFKNFYSNFTINNRGIALLNDDVITLNTINSWIDTINPSIAENLKQYSIISKQLPTLGSVATVDTAVTAKDALRSQAVNYPYSIAPLQSESLRLNEDVIVAKNSMQEFVRLGKDVYEAVQAKGNMSLYVKLSQNNSAFKQYKVVQPTTEIQLQETAEKTAQWLTTQNKLPKETREKIKENEFNCI